MQPSSVCTIAEVIDNISSLLSTMLVIWIDYGHNYDIIMLFIMHIVANLRLGEECPTCESSFIHLDYPTSFMSPV